MKHLLALPGLLSTLALSTALPPSSRPHSKPLPLIIWHGLGDRHNADGLHSIGDLVQEVNPGTFVYYIRVDEDGDGDARATFFGNLTEQIEQVCADIAFNEDLPMDLKTGKKRVDALGFSQGGQFLRGLVQRCEALEVRSLVTFGSQHNGIAGIRPCGTWDFVCKGAVALMKGNVYSDYVQGRVVPAQYYRTLNDSEEAQPGQPVNDYLEHSNFLADINNEREDKNEVYKERLSKLEKFVMFIFADDTTVIPKESGWFAEVTGEQVIPLQNRTLYNEDWLGLKKLDKKGALVLKSTPGDHMQFGDGEVLKETFKDYFGVDEAAKSNSQCAGCSNVEFREQGPGTTRGWDRLARPSSEEYL